MKALSQVITVDADKCVNCHACIAACPVKYCNNATADHVEVQPSLCIGCGACIAACTHKARHGVDDFPAWLEAVKQSVPMVAIAAPAIAANFPETWPNLLGWLRGQGVAAVFDVSFGAELTVRSYIEAIKKHKPQTVIAQPCPALVSYLEIYQPELLPSLAPADSPMLHTIKMIREYYPRYRDHQVMVISPCYAKKREFEDTGLNAWNVTYKSLQRHLDESKVNLSACAPAEFTSPAAERAVLFSTPGGLMRTVEREIPQLAARTRKIEGLHSIYHYFKELPQALEKGIAPPLIDCLNCERGCNAGPGTLNQDKGLDEIEHAIEERNKAAVQRYLKKAWGNPAGARKKLARVVASHWRPGLYDRSYLDRSSSNTIRVPNNQELETLYQSMHKTSPEDFLNCGACGYGNCKAMAIAIHNGLNKAVNCFHYERTSRTEMTSSLLAQLSGTATRLAETLRALAAKGQKQGASADDLVSLQQIAELTSQIKQLVKKGVHVLSDSTRRMKDIEASSTVTLDGIKTLADQVGSIWDIVSIISTITDQTKIIAFNAELEAASAGETGRSFEIVAGEIRRLANSTVESTRQIRTKIEEIQKSTESLIKSSRTEGDSIKSGVELANKLGHIFSDVLTFSENSEKTIQRSSEVQVASFEQTLSELEKLSTRIREFNT